MISKLPHTGTTIFTVMSQMAQEYNAINLSQGFPDFDVSGELIDLVLKNMKLGNNQYAPMPGVPLLRERISQKISDSYDVKYSPDSEITITGGATEALYSAITALVHPGDEVIIFEPAYDSYEPVILLNGGIPKRIKLEFPDYSIPWEQLEAALSDKTKLVIINSPHNPTGSVLSSQDMERLAEIIKQSGCYLLSDEVYEHIIFDEQVHQSALKFSEIKHKTIAVFSFGKTFHATGWKVGYMVADQVITAELRKVHQFLNFSVNTPIQCALAEYLRNTENYSSVAPFYEQKRNLFLDLIKPSRFEPLLSSGTYFQLLSYKSISDEGDFEIAERLTKEVGIASIPISVFYHDNLDNHILRFCFAKNDDTLKKAAKIICKI